MADSNWKLKAGATLDIEEVAKIACALKSLSVYTSLACDEESNPDELKEIVETGLAAMERLFDY